MKKIKNKKKLKYGVLAIVFSLAFVAPQLFQFIDFGVVEKENQPESWFDPRLSAFLYDDEIDETSMPFNAYGKSYIVCNVTDTAYTNFSVTATGSDEEYDVSYGTNYIPVDFGTEEKTFTVTFEDYTKIDWFVVEPVVLAMDFIDIDLDATPEEISFDSGGLVSFLITWNCTTFNNFTYDELYVEYDGIVINEIETGWDPSIELDPSIIAKARFDGIYLRYDIYTEVGSHTIKLKGNATVEYIIVVNGDYDGDGYGNVEEIQIDPLKAGLWYYPLVNGYFIKGTNYKVITDIEKEYGTFFLNIPEYFSGKNVLRIKIYSGALKNITIDNNDIRFKDISTDVKIYDDPQTLYYGNIEAGNHIITWNYAKECIFLIGFFINGTEVFIDEISSVQDSDCDGIPDQEEHTERTSFEIADSDNDGILDGYDLSPMTYLTLNNSKITEITIPTEDDTDTMISLSIKRPVEDFTTNQSMIWNGMNVQILPLLRVFGNSTIGKGELIDTYEKNIESYDLTDSNFNYGDAVPDSRNENTEYTLIKPLMSNDSIGYNLFYNISNSAKDDLVLNIRFDFVWGIISTESDIVSIVHFYDIDEPIILQSLTSIEIYPMDYALASPDSMVENEIIYNLVQNPSLGTFSDFGMTGDVVGSGSTDFYEVLDTINTLRESNPISVDENGNIDETEVIYLSFDMSQHNVLRNVTNMLTWTNVPDIEQDYIVEYRVANYIVNPSSESDLMPFSSNVMSGDNMKILYTNEYGNYSDDSPLEKRLHITDYPIFMRNQTFTDGDVLEVTYSATRDGIPLDQLPETIESTMNDKIIFSNKILIENKIESVENSLDSVLSFDLLYDIEKTAIDTRILEVPLSNLVFNSYSRTWVSILVDMMSKRMSLFLIQQAQFGGISNLIPLSFSYNIPNDVLFQVATVVDVLNMDELLTKRLGGVFSYWEGGLHPFREGVMIPDSAVYVGADGKPNARFIPMSEMMNLAGLSERYEKIAHYRASNQINIDGYYEPFWKQSVQLRSLQAESLAEYAFSVTDMYSYSYDGLAWASDIEILLQELRKPTTIIDLADSGLDSIDLFCTVKTDILDQLFNKFDPQYSIHRANLLTQEIDVLLEWETFVTGWIGGDDELFGVVMSMYKDVDKISWGQINVQVNDFGHFAIDKSEAARHVGMYIQTDINLGFTDFGEMGIAGLTPERIHQAVARQEENWKLLRARYRDNNDAFNMMQAQIAQEKIKIQETVRQVKLDLETKAQKMLERQIISERAKKFKRAKVFYGIICVVLIFTALLDFGEAAEASEEGDIVDVIYRTISGTSKLMLAMCLVAELVIRGRILKHLGNELVMKSLNKQLLKTNVYVSFFGLVLNIITLPEVWTAITDSGMEDWQKNLLYGLLIAALLFDVAGLAISIAALYGATLAWSWIPYVGLIIEVVILICFICFYPTPEEFEWGGADYEDSGFTFLNSNIKKNGGIRVGETIGYYYEGSSSQVSGDIYMQARLNPNDLGYSDWDGEYEEHSGYEYEDPIYISTGKTLTATNSCLSIDLDLQMSVDFDGDMQETFDDTLDHILDILIMNENIEYFYGNLTINPNDENMVKYGELKNEFIKYENTYEHNKTAETLDKLSNRIEFNDFLGDAPGDQTPGDNDWATTETDKNEFKVILRPNEDIYNDLWGNVPWERDHYDCVNEEFYYPHTSGVDLDDYIHGTGLVGGIIEFGFDDLPDGYLPSDRIKKIQFFGYVQSGNGWWCEVRWRTGGSWSEYRQIYQTEGDEWDILTWDNIDTESDLSNFQMKFQIPAVLGADVSISAFYVEITYTSTINEPDSEIVSEYKGHNNVMNVTALGQYANTEFYNDLGEDPGPQSSGTIDFWICKDQYSNIYIDGFLYIDRFGSILDYQGTDYLRKRVIDTDEWTHFSIAFTADYKYDLYINGIKCADDATRASEDISKVSFNVYNEYKTEDTNKYNISHTYFDAIDYSWKSDYYQWRNYAWDYSLDNITYYQGLRDAMVISTSISTDLRDNVVEMSSYIADFDFYFNLVGTEGSADVTIDLFNLPEGFSFTGGTHFEQDLEDIVSFEITDSSPYEYGGTYFFEMNVTIDSDDSLIYHERIPFNIPVVESVSFVQDNIIYENDDVSSGRYTSPHDFLEIPDNDFPGSYWERNQPGATSVKVVSDFQGHAKPIELYDPEEFQDCKLYTDYVYPDYRFADTIEFHISFAQSDEPWMFNIFPIGSVAVGEGITMWFQNDGRIELYDGEDYYFDAGTYTANTWYYIRIMYNVTDKWYLWIDGASIDNGDGFDFADEDDHMKNGMARLQITSDPGEFSGYCYFDAFVSIEDNDLDYKIGDNVYETDTEITGITESQMEIGDIVSVEFKTNTYSEVLIKFINNDVLQNKYTLLSRGSGILRSQIKRFIINESITFDEIRFTSFEYNYFDVSEILIIDTYTSVSEPFNPVDITNNGNIPEYTTFTYMGEVEVETEGGGGGYVVSVEYVELTLSSVTSNYVTLSNDQVLANCVPFVSMKMNTYGDDWDENMIDIFFESSPSKRVTGERGEGSGTVTLSIYIVEFDGVNVEVQSGTFSTATTYDDVDITAITQSKAFPMTYWKITGNDDDFDCAMVTTDFVDDDTIRMERDQATGTISGHWYVVEAQGSEFSVQKAEMSMTTETSKSATISSIDMSKSFVIGSWEANVASHSVQYASLSIYLNSPTQVRAIRNALYYFYSIPTINVFVVTFTGDESVQRGSFTFGNYDTVKSTDITAVTQANSMIKAGSMYGIMECDGTGNDDPEDSFIQYAFVDADTVNGERMGSTGEDGVGYWEVIEWVVGGGGGSSETKIIPVTEIIETLPGDNNEVSFDVNSTIENNINSRYIAWSSFSGENSFYMDNFSIDGIHISSPTNTIYNLIGNNLTCNKDEFVLNIIPEVTLTEMEYSLDGDTPVSFSGNTAKVPLPEIDGNHTIQVFGEDAGEIQYESEIRNFTIQYPIGIINPNETENTLFHEFVEDYDLFDNNSIGDDPYDWTIVDSHVYDERYITSVEMEENQGDCTGTIANARYDNDDYFSLTGDWNEGAGGYYFVAILTFNKAPEGENFYISFDLDGNYGDTYIYKNVGIECEYGSPDLDDDDKFHTGINTIKIIGFDEYTNMELKVRYFSMTDKELEGPVEVVESMNGANKPVQITNNAYSSEVSMERDFPSGYEMGNVSFSILRESITDKNIAIVTLSGTSGTLVLTLENNDLYNGTYASKDSLAADILKQDVWQEFVIFFNVSKGCQIFVDGVNTTMPDEYVSFSTGPPTDIDSIKIETKYTTGEFYSFWFDNFFVNKIEGGFMLDVYNQFVSLDNLQYSFDEGVKKSFDNRDLFNFPEAGLHTITIYGTDFYDDEYQSEVKIFSTGESYEYYGIGDEQHEIPTRWSDFDHEYGSNGGVGGSGSMEYNDGTDYTYVNAHPTSGGGESFVYSDPDGSDYYNNGWTGGWADVDDGVRYPSTSGLPGSYMGDCTQSDWFYVGMTDVTIPENNYVTKVEIHAYVRNNNDPEYWEILQAKWRFIGYTGWSTEKWTTSMNWAWDTNNLWTVTPGTYGDDAADELQVYFNVEYLGHDNTIWSLGEFYAKIYYEPAPTYRLETNVTFTVPSDDLASIDTFYYDYATFDTALDCDLDIWNWNTQMWYQLESNSQTGYVTDSFALTSDYIDESNRIRIRFETESTHNEDFDLRLDQLMIGYRKYEIKPL